MRLYHDGAAAVTIGGVRYVPGPDGGFDLPGPAAARQHRFPGWETGTERQARLGREELSRRQSPEALFDAVGRLVVAAEGRPADGRDAEIAELRKRLAVLEAGEPGEPEAGPEEPEAGKPPVKPRARRGAAT